MQSLGGVTTVGAAWYNLWAAIFLLALIWRVSKPDYRLDGISSSGSKVYIVSPRNFLVRSYFSIYRLPSSRLLFESREHIIIFNVTSVFIIMQ